MWGCSSVGRALRSQCRGREFESHQLHHSLNDALLNAWLFFPIEIKVGLATAARSNPEHLLDWINFSEERGGPTAN